MAEILSGQVFINDVDIWTEYGAFLFEERKGGRANQNAIFAASKTKKPVAVNIVEENGERYSSKLVRANEARDVTLHFAIFGKNRTDWLERYRAFISMLKTGEDGWLEFRFPALGLEMRMFYQDSTNFSALTYLWKEGKQAGHFKVKFREPVPSF